MSSRRYGLVFVACCMLLAYMYGLSSGKYHLFPSQIFGRAHLAAVDISGNWRSYLGIEPTRWLRASRHPGSGVTVAVPGGFQPGYTFVSSFFDGNVALRLLRSDGSAFNTWKIRFLDIWTVAESRQLGVIPWSNWDAGVMGALVLPDGSAVFTFNNGGLVKMNGCGGVVWKYPYHTHHSVFRAEDGTLWVPSVRAVYKPGQPTRFANISGPFIEDSILHTTAEGRQIREYSILDLLYSNHLEALVLANGVTATTNLTDDYTHLNGVTVLGTKMAGAFPGLQAGDILVSLRNLNLLFIFDPVQATIKWHQTGPWLRQHDPRFRSDGTISVFDNRSDNDGGGTLGGSRILAVNPASGAVHELYVAHPGTNFYSEIEGQHVYLENGDILISEADAGRLFEVNARQETVWEFINRYDAARVIGETHAYGRYSAAYFGNRGSLCERR